jgi:demethylmenaquinone methyltransferase/2-methoxy-6-polyprenyl-1,4-benzoquinol methylase
VLPNPVLSAMASTDTPVPPADGETVPFGYKTVPAEARQQLVNDIFTSVAARYDLMNDLMSGGLHRLWKDDLIGMLAPPRSDRPFHLIDVAGGTGDITLRFLQSGAAGCAVTLLDINPEMIAVGRRRLADAGLADRVAFVVGNAEALPFADKSFDAYAVAFGIRNVTHIDKALSEAYRVLKTGGRFLCLEFSDCDVPLLDRLYDFHSFEVIPRLGQLAAGDAEPYRYLVESIRKFPRQERFAAMIRAAGFSRVSFRNLTGGIAAIHSGWRT